MADLPEQEDVSGELFRDLPRTAMNYPPPYPTGIYAGQAIHPEMNATESLRLHRLNHCVEILKEALTIRLNAPLMEEIRAHLRLQRDEIAVLLDDM